MGFKQSAGGVGSRRKYREGVSVSVIKGGSSYLLTRIVLRPDAIKVLELKIGDRASILVGDGEDKGKILISKSKTGLKGVFNGSQLALMTRLIPGQSERFPPIDCEIEYAQGGVVVTLPPEHGGPAANVTSIKSKRA